VKVRRSIAEIFPPELVERIIEIDSLEFDGQVVLHFGRGRLDAYDVVARKRISVAAVDKKAATNAQ